MIFQDLPIKRRCALFYKLDSIYQQAVNSVEYSRSREEGIVHIRKDRLENAKEYY